MIEYAVVTECDEHPVSRKGGDILFDSYSEAEEFLEHLRSSPQWDRSVKIKTFSDEPDKMSQQITEVGKHVWIEMFGSDHLRDALKLGYPCDETYLLERAHYEGLAGYDIDWCGTITVEPVGCPSTEAITEIEAKLNRHGTHRHYLTAENVICVQSALHAGRRYFVCPHREACITSFMGYKFFKYVQHDLLKWKNLVGTTIRCKFGHGNRHASADDTILNVDVLQVIGNDVEIRTEHDSTPEWYTIYDGYIGSGEHRSGWHLSAIDDDVEMT